MRKHGGFHGASMMVAVCFASTCLAEVRLASLFGDGMVLQRDIQVPVWGWAEPGEQVSVSFAGQTASGVAAADGRWRVVLAPLGASKEPAEMSVTGSSGLVVTNVLVGDVWICSGQSNMQMPVSQVLHQAEEVAAADHPLVRLVTVPRVASDFLVDDVDLTWKTCTPETVASFSATAYFFARHLHRELDVPVGVVDSSWGGTQIAPWTAPAGFQQVPALKDIADKLDSFPAKKADGAINHQSPLALYNGMIAPLVPYGIRGALWYQGESNNGEGMLYFEKQKALIGGWRAIWNKPDLPFYFVQLAPYRYGGDPKNLAGIWEAQTATLSIPYTGMAVTVDISNLTDIHPRNKQDVGKRLALWALAQLYGKSDLVYSGPLYKSMAVEGDKIRLAFDHVGSGLVSRDGQPLNWFTIAGEDKNFVPAQAEIDGATVVVSADSVAHPVAVRFGWTQEAEPNLSNKESLPASPFRTDKW